MPTSPSTDPRAGQQAFERHAADGHTRIPVVREVLSDLDTPLSVYLKLADGPHTYLFESVEGGERFGRYSIIGLPAQARVRLRRQHAVRRPNTANWSRRATSPIRSPKSSGCAPSIRCRGCEGLPGFTGGLVGWFGFECIQYIEPRLAAATAHDEAATNSARPTSC